jgi:hypothetical protein
LFFSLFVIHVKLFFPMKSLFICTKVWNKRKKMRIPTNTRASKIERNVGMARLIPIKICVNFLV